MIYLDRCLIAITGPNLAGKTTLGSMLASETNARYFDVDRAKWTIIARSDRFTDSVERLAMTAAYGFNHFLAAQSLVNNDPVIVGAPYSHPNYHRMLRDAADWTKSPLVVFFLKVPEEEYARRIRVRQADPLNVSVVTDLATAARLRTRFIPMEGDEVYTIDSSRPVKECVQMMVSKLDESGFIRG